MLQNNKPPKSLAQVFKRCQMRKTLRDDPKKPQGDLAGVEWQKKKWQVALCKVNVFLTNPGNDIHGRVNLVVELLSTTPK